MNAFDLSGKVAVVTGGGGVLGGSIASALAAGGVRVAVCDLREEAASERVEEIRSAGGEAMSVAADVLDDARLRAAADRVLTSWERIDILVNAAGGNVVRARNDDRSIFEVPHDAFDQVLRLNLHGTVLPTLVIGEIMARQGSGSVVNISSMAAIQAISGVLGYSVAKAGIDTFTRWMAVELARKHGGGLRVNAVAPGFFVTIQNRDVLIDSDGSYTERARKVIDHTPMGRFGTPDELHGAILWLCSAAASFVTGVVIPVDGGFSSFSGI
jgi:NAD(P)-dependent dehydrogenase (short-subunit alcohol dehydrogenase family)